MPEFQQTTGNVQEPKGCRSRLGCLLVIAAVVALVIASQVLLLFHSKSLRLSRETTYITEPLTSDGQRVDYLGGIQQEYYPKNLDTDENGFRLLVQHVVMEQGAPPWHFQSICRQLGLDADQIQPSLPYEEPFDYLNVLVNSDEFDRAAVEALLEQRKAGADLAEYDARAEESAEEEESTEAGEEDDNAGPQNSLDLPLLNELIRVPWTLDELPIMDAWLEKNSPALDLLSEAVQKPIFFIPLVRQNENDQLVGLLLPHVQAARAFARGLCVRANYRIGTGDIDGAIDDIVTCKRFGRHVGHGVTLIHGLVGIALEGIADSIRIAGSPQHLPTKEQLQRLVRELGNLPPAASCDDHIRFERYMGLDIVQHMSHGEMPLDAMVGASSEWMVYFGYLGFDWDIVAARLNEHYDMRIAGNAESAAPSPARLIFNSRSGRSKTLGDLLAVQLVPGLNSVREVGRRRQCVEQMKQIVLAMLLYERDHATLPPAYSVDAQGAPLHSWRVLLLPYLGQGELYDKIRLDEPWDSEHNRQFHGEVVGCYRCPSELTAQAGQTTYSVIVGPEMPFEAGEGKMLTDFGSSTGQLILVSERAVPVCWMEPTREIPQDDADAGSNFRGSPRDATKSVANGIASQHSNGANFGCRDGSVQFFTDTLDNVEFQKRLRGHGFFD